MRGPSQPDRHKASFYCLIRFLLCLSLLARLIFVPLNRTRCRLVLSKVALAKSGKRSVNLVLRSQRLR